MVCYCLAQRGVYIHFLTPFLPTGSAVTHSNRSYCLPSNAQREQQHCSHSWQSPCLHIHHSLSLLSAPHFLLTHSWESFFHSTTQNSSCVGWSSGWEMQGRNFFPVPPWKAVTCPARTQSNKKSQGRKQEYAWVSPVCHVDLHQGTPSPRQPSRSPSAISNSGMKMKNDKPLPCGVFPRALIFPLQSLLP